MRKFRYLAGMAVAAAAVLVTPTVAHGDVSAYVHGPDPTESSIEASRGTYATAQTTVSRTAAVGFGGGTIYYPTTTAEGTFGAVAISPGFTATQSSISWFGPRLASFGFVVFTIDTNSTLDQPSSRGDQLLAALDYLTDRSSVRTRVDASRLAVAGHSMGGGGTLAAAAEDGTLKAGVPLAPYNTDKTWSEVRTPMLIMGGQSDTVAPVSSHSIPFYNSLGSTEKGYLELRGASHFFPNSANTTVAKYMISWLKRWVDDDTRYDQFLCPVPNDSTISQYRGTCPHS
ncbi:alpha/beta hydrolase family protein [Actinophytocola oryzae]|uniref:Alpha/beta hydrolase family protein n=1 Tax=Actinophytocola oryzae TaxID=502181 RepID=A0A4R7W3C4_9PSEU|nr:dienelactone hydrolase family protein [Actinophytocola oryzae]TDV57143.1 alpha/beta hydrolase family protein [Actinophytocola oryzae]